MIKAFRHFGITVKNLERAITFYCDGLGFSLQRKFERPQAYTQDVTGVTNTRLHIALISYEDVIVELLEYVDRADRSSEVSVHYAGAGHICITVDSIEKSMAHLTTYGARFENPIVSVPPGPGEHNKVVYGRDPDGIAFELVEIKNSRS